MSELNIFNKLGYLNADRLVRFARFVHNLQSMVQEKSFHSNKN